MGSGENETRCNGYIRFGSTILADPDQSGHAVCHIQNNRLVAHLVGGAIPMMRIADRLVEILDAQLREHFVRSKFKA